jgi:hypothetical protein
MADAAGIDPLPSPTVSPAPLATPAANPDGGVR